MKSWEKYKEKLEALNKALAESLGSLELEYELKTPTQEDIDSGIKVPYVLLRFYTDEKHYHERKVELFEYYLEQPVEETSKLIKDMAEEFLMEIEQSEYGGG